MPLIVCFPTGIELVVFALHLKQLIMGSAFNDAATFKDDDDIAILNGRKPMGDDEYRAALHNRIHALLNELLGARVNRGSSFI